MDQNKYDEAAATFAAGNFSRASDLYASLLAGDLDAAQRVAVLVKLASCRDELGEFEPALAALKQALDIDGTSVAAWNNIGIICGKLDRLDEAREAFERALAADPNNVAILINLGSISLKLGDVAAAKSCLDLALELAPAHPIAHANLALALLLFGRIEEAEDALRLAVLYGFNGADPILERIEKMKSVRREMFEAKESSETEEAEPSESALLGVRLEEARTLLRLLEEERARQASGEVPPGEIAGPSIDEQIESLQRHIADLESQFSQ